MCKGNWWSLQINQWWETRDNETQCRVLIIIWSMCFRNTVLYSGSNGNTLGMYLCRNAFLLWHYCKIQKKPKRLLLIVFYTFIIWYNLRKLFSLVIVRNGLLTTIQHYIIFVKNITQSRRINCWTYFSFYLILSSHDLMYKDIYYLFKDVPSDSISFH